MVIRPLLYETMTGKCGRLTGKGLCLFCRLGLSVPELQADGQVGNLSEDGRGMLPPP
jgi:hypothetical protein